jgi:glycosyltransferase involved in cell wall biosynthesis
VSKTSQYVDQIIVVDDGSLDGTRKMAEVAGASIISHESNLGKGAAMKTAAQSANGEILVFMDGDGQHDPADIPGVIDPIINQGFDFVIGSRHIQESKVTSPIFKRRLANRLASFTIFIITSVILPLTLVFKNNTNRSGSGNENNNVNTRNTKPTSKKLVSDCTSGFRAIRKECWSNLNLVSNGFQIETEMIYEARKNKLAFTEVPISCKWNGNGSRLSIIKDGYSTLRLLCRKLLQDIRKP